VCRLLKRCLARVFESVRLPEVLTGSGYEEKEVDIGTGDAYISHLLLLQSPQVVKLLFTRSFAFTR
jgi:hypothetical protein